MLFRAFEPTDASMLVVLASNVLPAIPAQAVCWEDTDVLRNKLTQAGVRVVQKNCSQRGLQGLDHPSIDTLVMCRSQKSPVQVWDTLAHEATHRMQHCAGGPISNQKHHPRCM